MNCSRSEGRILFRTGNECARSNSVGGRRKLVLPQEGKEGAPSTETNCSNSPPAPNYSASGPSSKKPRRGVDLDLTNEIGIGRRSETRSRLPLGDRGRIQD